MFVKLTNLNEGHNRLNPPNPMILSFESLANQLEDDAPGIEVLNDFLQGLSVDSAVLGSKSLAPTLGISWLKSHLLVTKHVLIGP